MPFSDVVSPLPGSARPRASLADYAGDYDYSLGVGHQAPPFHGWTGGCAINGTYPAGCLHRSGAGKYSNTYANPYAEPYAYSKGKSDAATSA